MCPIVFYRGKNMYTWGLGHKKAHLLGIMYNTRQSKWSVDLCTEWNSIVLRVLDGATWETAATTTSLYIHMTVKHYQAHSAENRCVCKREREISHISVQHVSNILTIDLGLLRCYVWRSLYNFNNSAKNSKINTTKSSIHAT